MKTHRLALALSVLLAAGCTGMPKPPPDLGANQAIIAPRLIMTIPAPSALGQDVELAQNIVAHFRGQSFTFDLQAQISADKLDLVAMDGFGRRALTVSWKQNAPTYEQAPWLPPFFRAADILAAFVIAYWPDDVVAGALHGTGAAVETSGTIRRITRDGHDLIIVDYGPGEGWNRSAKLRNLAFDYEIDVQSAENRP